MNAIDVLFIRHMPLTAVAAGSDFEWLEPVQMCCAFECRVTLLLLAPPPEVDAVLAAQLSELVALGIDAILALNVPTGPHWRAIEIDDASRIIAAHPKIVAV